MRSLLKRPTMAIGMGLVALGVGRPATALSIVPMSMQDSIHEAAAIFTGHVLQAQSRWANPERRFMKTDYLFAVDDAILPNGDVRTGGQVVLTYPGGTIDGIHEGIAGLELPQLGKTYMMMLRNDWTSPRM